MLQEDEDSWTTGSEKILPNGYIVALACGPLKKPRYINENIEKELADFKMEIKEKFEKSTMNKTYVFPRWLTAEDVTGIEAANTRRPMTTDVAGSPIQRNRTLTGTNL